MKVTEDAMMQRSHNFGKQPYLHVNRYQSLHSINVFETNLKAIDDISMSRSGCFVEILKANMNKGYGQQIWAAKALRHSYLVQSVKPCHSDNHKLTKCHCKMDSF